MNHTNHSISWLRSILDDSKFDGSNLYDWYRNLRIVLKREGKDYVLRKPLPEKLGANATRAVYDAWNKHYTEMIDVRNLMLATMSSELREQYEKMESPKEIITDLIQRFQGQTRVERFNTVGSLLQCKLPEGKPVGRHFNMMLGYVRYLNELGCPISDKVATEFILQSLQSTFDKFLENYTNKGETKTLTELHSMLRAEELKIKKGTRNVLKVQKGNGFKKPRNDKARNKDIQIVDQDVPMSSIRPESGPSDKCSYCEQQEHLVTNCNKFLEDLDQVWMKYKTLSLGICVA